MSAAWCAVPDSVDRSRTIPHMPTVRGGAASPGSSHLHRNRAQEVLLADLHAAMAQDRIGGGEMEIDVRQHEMIEIVVALHVALVGRAERECELTIGGAVDLLGVERLEKGDGLGEARLELIDRRLVV